MLGAMRCVGTLTALVLLAGCSGLSSLSTGSDAPRPTLSPNEQAVVRAQVQAALREERYADAWNQEVEAGADRRQLEAIAVAALEKDSGDATDMLTELRGKYGSLTPGATQRVNDLVQSRMSEGRWTDAAELAIAAAADAPTYSTAFRVYEQTPPRHAADVLEVIQDARAEAQEVGG